LTGRQAFEGETVTDIIACVMKSEPDYSLLPRGTPASVRALLRQCLRKDPNHRLHDIADARIAIEDSLIQPVDLPTSGLMASNMRWGWMAFGLAAFVMIAAPAAWRLTRTGPESRGVTHLQIGVESADQLTKGLATPRPTRTAFALSPNGRT